MKEKVECNYLCCTYFIVSSSAPGSLCSSLNAGIIKDIYFSAGSETWGQGTWNKILQKCQNHPKRLQTVHNIHTNITLYSEHTYHNNNNKESNTITNIFLEKDQENSNISSQILLKTTYCSLITKNLISEVYTSARHLLNLETHIIYPFWISYPFHYILMLKSFIWTSDIMINGVGC